MIKNPFEYARVEKLKLTREQEKEIKGLYQEALEELRRSFKYFNRSTSNYSLLKKIYIKQAKKEIVDIMNYVDNRTESLINGNMEKMVEIVFQNNEIFLRGSGYKDYINNPMLKSDVINRIYTGKIYQGKWNLSSAIWGDNQAKINEMNSIIAKGVAENKSLYEISKSLERYVNPNARKSYEWNKMFPGSRKNVDYNAQRLARTTIQHAYQQSFVSATFYNPFIEAYRWVTSGGHNVCQLCLDRESLDEYGLGNGIFPKDKLPLDHPNGMCTFEVVMSMTDDEISDCIADWYMGIGDKRMNKQLDKFSKYLKKN